VSALVAVRVTATALPRRVCAATARVRLIVGEGFAAFAVAAANGATTSAAAASATTTTTAEARESDRTTGTPRAAACSRLFRGRRLPVSENLKLLNSTTLPRRPGTAEAGALRRIAVPRAGALRHYGSAIRGTKPQSGEPTKGGRPRTSRRTLLQWKHLRAHCRVPCVVERSLCCSPFHGEFHDTFSGDRLRLLSLSPSNRIRAAR
jgi:hypothetical protein